VGGLGGVARRFALVVGARLGGAQLRGLAQQLGGHATLQRASLAAGDADKLLAGVFTPLAPVQQRIQRVLQQQFDPAGVFATGRMGAS
jgi:glycolate oxidase FAD binding subunit